MAQSAAYLSKWMVSIVALAVVGVGAWFFIQPESKDELTTRLLPVNVATITKVDSFQQTRNYTGTIRARSQSDLAFELSGRIDQVLVDDGQRVEKGQVLAILDKKALNARLKSAKAQKKQAEAVLAELENGPRQETVAAARSTYEATQSEFQIANSVWNRIQKLKESNAISDDEFDRAKSASAAAKSRMDAAEKRWRELADGTRPERKAAQRATVEQLDAAIEEINVSLKNSELIAPFRGIVSQRFLDPGTIAPASTPVLQLIENEKLEAWIGLPTEQASNMAAGDVLPIRCGNHDPFDVKLMAKIDNLDPLTQTQTVIFEIPNAQNSKLVPGQLCELPVKITIKKTGYWIPTAALSRGLRGLWSVMAVDSSNENYVIEKRDVQIVYNDGDRVLVEGTVSSGDQIVLDGLHRVVSGQKVSIQQQPMFPLVGSNGD